MLGHTIKAGGGIDDGEQVLDIVASHPSTAHHIAFELAQRLVADEPPPALVERAAARFRETNGDLREVVRTIVTSPEFLAPAVRDAKFKTPFELVVSAVRTTGATVSDARRVRPDAAAARRAALHVPAADRIPTTRPMPGSRPAASSPA